jgi:hypothetical protein
MVGIGLAGLVLVSGSGEPLWITLRRHSAEDAGVPMINKEHWQRYSIPSPKRSGPRWAYLTAAVLAAGLTSWLGIQVNHAFWVLGVYDNVGDLSPGLRSLLVTIGWTAAGLASLSVMVWTLWLAIRPTRVPGGSSPEVSQS